MHTKRWVSLSSALQISNHPLPPFMWWELICLALLNAKIMEAGRETTKPEALGSRSVDSGQIESPLARVACFVSLGC